MDMSQSMHNQVMELKEEAHRIIFRPELPLINPETVFSLGTWENILGLIEQHLCLSHFQVHPIFTMDFIINDLYFSKVYSGFDFKCAKKLFSQIGSVEHQEHGYDDGPILFIEEWDTRLYYYKDAVRFVVGSHEESNGVSIKGGRFSHEPIRWHTTKKQFLQFVDITERVLMSQGVPMVCRAFMKVEIPHTRIDVQYFYQMPTILDFPVKGKLPKGVRDFEKQRLKIIVPETIVTIS